MKKGFGSVLIVIILGCMITLCLAFAEAGSSYCARSCAENYCLVTGRSILSEYQKDLNRRYGLFMVRGYGDELSSLARFYLSADTFLSSSVIERTCTDASADSSGYRGLNTELFTEQVKKLGTLEIAGNAASRLGITEAMKGASESEKALSSSSFEEELDELCMYDEEFTEEDEEEDPELFERIRQAIKLRKRLRQSEDREAVKASGKSVPAGIKSELPSKILGFSPRSILSVSGGVFDISAEDLLLDEYVIGCCSNDQNKRDDTVLELEAEYVLYGAGSDSANKRLVRNSLYALRFSLNMASILSEPALASEISAAASVFSLIPRPVALAAIASIWAGIETKQDLSLLSQGGTVPVIKDASDFTTDIFAFLDGRKSGGSSGKKEGFGTYEDYLRILLAMLSEEEKAARLMDVMQMNVVCIDKKNFSFTDYAYGFELDADFSRKHYLSNPFSKGGGGHIHETFVYR